MKPLRASLRRMGTELERRVFRRNVYRRAFGSGDGALVWEDLQGQFGFLDSTTIDPRVADPALGMAHREGQRSVVTYIRRLLGETDEEAERRAASAALADPLGGD